MTSGKQQLERRQRTPKLVTCIGCGYLSRKIVTPQLEYEFKDNKGKTTREVKDLWEYDEIPYYCRSAQPEEAGGLYFGEQPYRDFDPLKQVFTLGCLRRAYNLEGELAVEQIAPLERIDRYLKVIRKERPCPFWFPHSAGLTPVGHQQLQEKQEEATRGRWSNLICVLVGAGLSGGFTVLAVVATRLLT